MGRDGVDSGFESVGEECFRRFGRKIEWFRRCGGGVF